MFSHILLTYDGSEHSNQATRIAGDMARCQLESRLTILQVISLAHCPVLVVK